MLGHVWPSSKSWLSCLEVRFASFLLQWKVPGFTHFAYWNLKNYGNQDLRRLGKGIQKASPVGFEIWARHPKNLFHHERKLAAEFYRVKNLGREAGSIERAEIWLRKYILQSEEHLAEWEAYLSASETAKTNFETEARRKQIEKQKVAAAKKTLAKARQEIIRLIMTKKLESAGNRLHTFHLKLTAKLHPTQREHGKPRSTVEGPLRPNLNGFIERTPNKLRPLATADRRIAMKSNLILVAYKLNREIAVVG